MGDNMIVNDKLMAYSFIMVHEGYPCVFWYDYYNNGLARPRTPNGIDALIQAHHKYAGGDSQILHADPDLYIMQRVGWKDDKTEQPGLIYVLNNLGDKWSRHLRQNQVGQPEVRAHRLGRPRRGAPRRAHHRRRWQRRIPCPTARLRHLRAGVVKRSDCLNVILSA